MLVNQLKAFFAVARLGSITLAAKQLTLSQPTVTTQIRALEEAYGVELFYRGGRRLALSDAGVRLMPRRRALECGDARGRRDTCRIACEPRRRTAFRPTASPPTGREPACVPNARHRWPEPGNARAHGGVLDSKRPRLRYGVRWLA